ncbi:MAG: tRNA (cytidine(34)-2'-O)-methyltransferase [Pseudomonadota bacterium]
MLNVALYQPEIPPNTGNIIRLCANTGFTLHLIEPLGFSMEDRELRRAGLDYHEYARVQVHPNLAALASHTDAARWFPFSTRGRTPYFAPAYAPGDTLLFGPETRGLPDTVLNDARPQHRLRIPMLAQSRSLNLSNAVAIAAYAAWQQLAFAGAAPAGTGSTPDRS